MPGAAPPVKLELLRESARGAPRQTPLLFVHGAWHAAWCWQDHFLPYFADLGYECWAPSVRAHGGSDGRDRLRWTSLTDYVDDLVPIVRAMPRPPIAIGHSMGGLLVQKLARREKLAGAVLMASVPPTWGALPATLRVARRHPLEFLKVNATLSLYPLIASPRLARDAFFSSSMPEEEVRRHWERLQDESYRAFLGMLGPEVPHGRHGRTPTLVVRGSADRIISAADAGRTAQVYDAESETFPGMAHDLMLEPGWEAVAARIAAWSRER